MHYILIFKVSQMINEIQFYVIKRHGDVVTMDVIEDISYLDAVINETLRLYPPAPVIERTCTEDFMLVF